MLDHIEIECPQSQHDKLTLSIFQETSVKEMEKQKKHSTRALLDDASSWHEHLPQATESPCHAQLTAPTVRQTDAI